MIFQATVLASGDKEINKTHKDLCPEGVYILVGRIDEKHDKKNYSMLIICDKKKNEEGRGI